MIQVFAELALLVNAALSDTKLRSLLGSLAGGKITHPNKQFALRSSLGVRGETELFPELSTGVQRTR